MVFDFDEYSGGAIREDILFTRSMWKADFDVSKAKFLVANVSKPPKKYAEWNYQMFCCLNSQLSYDDILPHLESIRGYMQRALSSPEAALDFLGILSSLDSRDSEDGGERDEYACVDRVSTIISANPQLTMNIRWVKNSIKKKIDLVTKKMLGGKIPMPESSIAIMGADPIAFFNRLRLCSDGSYSFTDGDLVVPDCLKVKELSAHEFRYGGYEGDLLAFRNPLTHWVQIRKLACVSHQESAWWYRHLNQVVLFNVHDETNLGMAGADYDGDMCFLTKLFVTRFRQADYIIYNNNDAGSISKVILTEELVQKSIRANLQPNMLGVICNINTRALELLSDRKTLRKFVRLAGYMDDKSFNCDKLQTPYYAKFKDMLTAVAYLERLNHELTTLSELEVDRPNTGYVNRFNKNQPEYTLPYMPYWFGNVKGMLEPFMDKPAESISRNNFGEQVRTLCKNYDNKTIKVIQDTHKSGKWGQYVQRLIELMTDGDSIMAGVQRYVQENILDMEVDANNCYCIKETLEGASCLDLAEVDHVSAGVYEIYRDYCISVAGHISAWKDGLITEDDFNIALDEIIDASDVRLRSVSSDRAAIAFAAYQTSLAKTKNLFS